MGLRIPSGFVEHRWQFALDLDPGTQLIRAEPGPACDRSLDVALGHQIRYNAGADAERLRAPGVDVDDLRVGGVDQDPAGRDRDLELAAVRRERDRVGDRQADEGRDDCDGGDEGSSPPEFTEDRDSFHGVIVRGLERGHPVLWDERRANLLSSEHGTTLLDLAANSADGGASAIGAGAFIGSVCKRIINLSFHGIGEPQRRPQWR